MDIYVMPQPDGTLSLRARLEGPGGLVGDWEYDLAPGESLLGMTYDEWRAASAGGRPVTLDPDKENSRGEEVEGEGEGEGR